METGSDPHIVVIGGGTGSFTLLRSLKKHTRRITALVNMADDGGSTGVLRDELGVLPPGDIRQCLVALSESSEALRELFNYRFPPDTTFAGHSFGNLFLSAVEKMSDNFGRAVHLASDVLNITGEVVPITLQNCNLALRLGDQVIKGQYAIETTPFEGKADKPTLWLEPHAPLNPVAKSALETADLLVIAPGNLYASLIPALLVDEVRQTLSGTSVPIVYVCNLANKAQHTQDFQVHDYVHELEKYIGRGTITHVLYNTSQPSRAALKKYAQAGEFPVPVDSARLQKASYHAIAGNFLAPSDVVQHANDTLIQRSFIRHDADAVAMCLLQLVNEK